MKEGGEDFFIGDFSSVDFEFEGEISTKYDSSDFDKSDLNSQKIHRYRQDTRERKLLSHWVVWTVSVWLIFTGFTLIFNHIFCFNISDAVCGVMLGTTSANILGLAYIVLKGLFPEGKQS
jgi:hypothetical protein